MMKTAFVAAVAAAAFAVPSLAQERTEPNPWIDCGLGAMIFPDDNLEVAAAVSNIVWDLGTTAVTSAASSPDTCNGWTEMQTAMFIERTYDALEVETAAGEGVHLSAVAHLMGCSADASPVFVQEVRSEMASAFAEPGYAAQDQSQKAEAFYLKASAVAGAQCSAA